MQLEVTRCAEAKVGGVAASARRQRSSPLLLIAIDIAMARREYGIVVYGATVRSLALPRLRAD
jgi:hypothetical protein